MNDHTSKHRIVVGVDGSDSSIAALQQAAELAVALNCPLEAIMTWDFTYGYDPRDTQWSPDGGTYPQSEAEKDLAAAVARAFPEDPPLPIATQVMRGPSAGVLIHESKRARMLVLGSRGHGGFVGLLLGSVSAACSAHAQCPVLIVHAPKVEK
jgi:nucleotide-binding universal stress UspA family protein